MIQNKDSSLFIQIEGNYDFNKDDYGFFFHLNNKQKYFSRFRSFIGDPLYAVTLNLIFTGKSGLIIANDFLNSILYPNGEQNLEIMNVIEDEFSKIIYNIDYKDKISNIILYKAKIDEKEYFLKLEFQLKIKYNEKYKFETCDLVINTMDYKKYLEVGNINELKRLNNSVFNFRKLYYTKLVEINLSSEIKKINKEEDVIINNKKLNDKGKEWIKLLGIRFWCEIKDGPKFIIPYYDDLSKNPLFVEAIKLLGSFKSFDLAKLRLDEEYLFDNIEYKRNEMLIKTAFDTFKLKNNFTQNFFLEEISFEDVDEHYIKHLLSNDKEEGNAEKIEEFINYLKKQKYID